MVVQIKIECPLCNSTQVNQVQGIASPVYFICNNCKLIFIHDNYLITPDKEKARYDTHQNSIEDEGYVHMFERFIDDSVLPFAKKGGTCLDYGSGPAPVLQILLERRGFSTEIYDPYYAPDKVYVGKKYDLVTCTEVLEHIYQPQHTWSIFAECLNKDGILAIMTLFYPPLDQFQNWWYRRDVTHVRFYDLTTFAWICENYPLKILWSNGKNMVVMKRM